MSGRSHNRYRRMHTGRRRGAVAVAMVILMVLLAVVVLGLVLNGARHQDLAVTGVSSTRAFYAAEAGINMAMREAAHDVDYDNNGEVGSITSTPALQSALHSSEVTVERAEAGALISLNSLGRHEQSRHAVHTMVSVEQAQQSSSEFPYGVAVSGSIAMSNNTRIDAFDSSTGTYSPGGASFDLATIATSGTGSNQISLSGSATVHGHAYVGDGGDPTSVINTSGSASIVGETAEMDGAMSFYPIGTPDGLPASSGDQSFGGGGTATLTAGTYHYDSFSVGNNRTVVIEGDVVLYCSGSFDLGNNARVLLDDGATLIVYADQFSFSQHSRMNLPSSPAAAEPRRVHLLQTGSSDFSVDNFAVVAGIIVAPDAEVSLRNNSKVFGAIQAEHVSMSNHTRFTQDLAITNGSGSGSGGGGSGSGTAELRNWAHVKP